MRLNAESTVNRAATVATIAPAIGSVASAPQASGGKETDPIRR
jgi:predicted phage gp36 major capsid-like protein